MPELRECLAHFLHFNNIFQTIKPHSSFQLLHLWADTKDGKGSQPSDEDKKYHVTNGLVVCLDDSCTIKRGTNHRQTPIWPPRCKPKAKSYLPLSALELKGGEGTSRAILLDFGPLWLSIAYLTHTSLQWYKKETWYQSIAAVPRKLRGFRVAVAFEFESYFLAFLSLDNMFQPTWADSRDTLPHIPPDVYSDFDAFLVGVTGFVDRILKSRKSCLAADEVRLSEPRAFFGVGVYTLCEIFFMAGIPMHISVQDLCKSPSRVARLCLSLWEFARRSHTDLWAELLRPAIVDGILAPTREQRRLYSNWLMVYGKSFAMVPRRMAALIDSEEAQDIFEPGYLRLALEEHPQLGPLVFGEEEWVRLGGSAVVSDDPLTAFFQREGMLQNERHLRPREYDTLVPPDFSAKNRARRPTYLYYEGGKTTGKQLWTIGKIPNELQNGFDLLTGSEKDTRLFSNIVRKSVSVAVGPLEYCGNGRVIKTPHSEKRVFVVQGDPALSDAQFLKYITGMYRIKLHLDRPGQAKASMTSEHRSARNKVLLPLTDVRRRLLTGPVDGNGSEDDGETVVPSSDDTLVNEPPLKKRRLTADKLITINFSDSGEQENTRTRRSSRSQR
ncbi:hypothetical protein EYR40_011129 [Pleurotus pulmonarius]|nr:hypothetical protein EYR36_002899 [Pleurotus pulmonarius]KAF4587108.1 hypothetical protein EYR40_011129 [Pleurotus pulmonarius]